VKVTIVRGGGLAGIATRTELDGADLSDADARAFAEAVGRAGPVMQSPEPRGRPLPDQTLYDVRVDDGGHEVRARFDDETLPDEVRRLVEWVDARPERTHRIER
jgi:hypothetical protein